MNDASARLPLLLSLALVACGDTTTGRDTYAVPDAAPHFPSGDDGNGVNAPPESHALASITKGDQVGLLAFDDANVYAALFSSVSTNGEMCGWKSRWIRVPKGGGS